MTPTEDSHIKALEQAHYEKYRWQARAEKAEFELSFATRKKASDDLETPSSVLDQQLASMEMDIEDVCRDFDRPRNAGLFIEREEKITAMARKLTELSLAIQRAAWAGRGAA